MKKKIWISAATVVIIVCCAVIICVSVFKSPKNIYDMPKDAWNVATGYLNAYQKSTEKSVEYMYFGDREDMREAYATSENWIADYIIESVEKINDNLYNINITVETRPYERTVFAYNFVGYIDGKWYYMNNVDYVPAEISDNLDPSQYDYDNDLMMSPNEVIISSIQQ